jgi:ectoine hydroxylase-related dioxygenase (phytanoyl-CoA dioxygenase family)
MDDGSLVRATAGFDPAPHIARLKQDGYTIVENFLDASALEAFRESLESHLGTHRGRNAFEGRTTERVYTLVGRGKVFEDTADDPRLLAILDAFLAPNYLLSASHAICIFPGEVAQGLHTDEAFYQVPRPRPALGISVIGAIDAFTAENGGTVVLPGSHVWTTQQGLEVQEAFRAGRHIPAMDRMHAVEMPAGAILILQGTLVHGAGANVSDAPRLAYTNQYCQPWLRTQENFYLSVPRERVMAMSPALKSLLGYSITPPFLGMVTASHPLKTLDADWTPPITRAPVHQP